MSLPSPPKTSKNHAATECGAFSDRLTLLNPRRMQYRRWTGKARIANMELGLLIVDGCVERSYDRNELFLHIARAATPMKHCSVFALNYPNVSSSAPTASVASTSLLCSRPVILLKASFSFFLNPPPPPTGPAMASSAWK